MNDRRSEEQEEPEEQGKGPVPRDLPDQQAGGSGEDDRWDTDIPEAAEAPKAPEDEQRDGEAVPQEPAD